MSDEKEVGVRFRFIPGGLFYAHLKRAGLNVWGPHNVWDKRSHTVSRIMCRILWCHALIRKGRLLNEKKPQESITKLLIILKLARNSHQSKAFWKNLISENHFSTLLDRLTLYNMMHSLLAAQTKVHLWLSEPYPLTHTHTEPARKFSCVMLVHFLDYSAMTQQVSGSGVIKHIIPMTAVSNPYYVVSTCSYIYYSTI